MTFSEKALPYAQLGIPVFPLEPREKKPVCGLDWDAEYTTDIKKINKWNAINPEYNCGLVATPEGVSLSLTKVHWKRKRGRLASVYPKPEYI